MSQKQLYDLIKTDSAEAVLDEVRLILKSISPDFDSAPVSSAFIKTIGLYEGKYPDYQACNTEFHDLRHSIETFLAMARLIHGAILDGKIFRDDQIVLGLIAAILHDAGYIQENSDRDGTGAKYTASHVQRSMDFLERYGKEEGLSDEVIANGRAIIHCTDLSVDIKAIAFSSTEIQLLGKMLGAADLLAQMADRTYLEKLLFLYHEYSEAKLGDYENELDLLKQTVGFYDFIAHRLESTLDSTDRFMSSHFAAQWKINRNLYQEAIERQKNYLLQILKTKSDPRRHLRREKILFKVTEKFGKK
ncbi:hypothetical protein ACFL0M_07625 [Thermodesulfobacteriota bacterium]